ncbi:hypothetical protein KCP78_10715 [Salmonella enterica subsp. enterica]|nr:hypothetical protein KCP78_10715 [Salmonella enterica subsp. enterica]
MVELLQHYKSSAGRLHGRRVQGRWTVYRSRSRYDLPYAAVKQPAEHLRKTATGEIYESAQFLYILVAASPLFSNHIRVNVLTALRVLTFKTAADAHHVRCAYPNPSVQLLRTDRVWRQSDSINATSSAIVKYVLSAPVS